MRFITVNLRCDWDDCDTVAPEESGEVSELVLALNRKPGRTVGLCAKHREALNDILEPLLAKGVVDKSEPKTRPSRAKTGSSSSTREDAPETIPAHVGVDCKVCGHHCKGNVGLAQHLKKKHDGMTREEHDQLPDPEM